MVVGLLVEFGFCVLLNFLDERGRGKWEVLGEEGRGVVEFAGAIEDLADVTRDGSETVLQDV